MALRFFCTNLVTPNCQHEPYDQLVNSYDIVKMLQKHIDLFLVHVDIKP